MHLKERERIENKERQRTKVSDELSKQLILNESEARSSRHLLLESSDRRRPDRIAARVLWISLQGGQQTAS